MNRNVEKTLKGKKFIKQEIEKCLDPETAQEVWDNAHTRLGQFYGLYKDVPKKVAMHTDGFIFPAAAIYLALKEYAPDKAYEIMKTTMKKKSERSGRSLAKMAKIPGFTRFFLSLWPPVSRKMFGEAAGFKNVFYPAEKGCFRMDITQCPYHRYLTELGCPELNILFCDNDVYSYGNIPGLKFTRTKTIGAGNELCDFRMELVKKG
ncbi:MAG: L-2-amino-thiazoline-4-carboxylic acid hydrolase [Lachnospiraceae bacterium]|nr:L-2-amino-thiazoline-4-carboxylic acid hydrolase [Lachnospiraceae bacterium]